MWYVVFVGIGFVVDVEGCFFGFEIGYLGVYMLFYWMVGEVV